MPTIDALPIAPNTLRPDSFASEMDTFLAALITFRDQLVEVANAWVLGTSATSTTALAFGLGSKTLTIQTDKGYVTGMDVVIAATAAPSDRMIGTVTSYDTSTGVLVVNVYSSTGSGTVSSWGVSLTVALDTSQFVLPAATQTLTNKTLNLAFNTLVATSAQLAAAVTDETGSGALVFATSPALAGTPTAPTATAGTNTTQLATTAFVQAAVTAFTTAVATLTNKTINLANNTLVATSAQLASAVTDETGSGALVFATSPALAGTPTAPTATAGTNTTQLATTAFVQAAVTALIDASPGALDTLNELAAALGDDPNFATTMTNALAAKAPLASPALTGTPTAPTATAGTNTTQLATTAFVQSAINSGKMLATATGAIAKGNAVTVQTDGTVSAVTNTIVAGSLGAEQTFASANPTTVYQVYGIPGTNQVAVIYNLAIVIGTVDPVNNTITFGSPVALAGAEGSHCAVWHPIESKLVIFYQNSNLTGVVGTLSGNTITLGTPVAGAVQFILGTSAVYNPHQNRFVVTHQAASSSAGAAISLWSLSGATLTQTRSGQVWSGAAVTGSRHNALINIDGTPRVLLASAGHSGTNNIGAAVVTINADTVTFGTSVAVATSAAGMMAIKPTNVPYKYALFSLNDTSSYAILTVSGTSVTASGSGAWTTLSGNAGIYDIEYDEGKGRLLVMGQNNATDNYATVWAATLSGSALALDDGTVMNTATTTTMRLGYVGGTADRVVVAFRDNADNNYGHTRVWDSGDSQTTANDWIGFAEAAISNGAQGWIALKGGIHTGQTGLTTGYQYYLDDAGVLQQSGSRPVGVALSSTNILLEGNA